MVITQSLIVAPACFSDIYLPYLKSCAISSSVYMITSSAVPLSCYLVNFHPTSPRSSSANWLTKYLCVCIFSTKSLSKLWPTKRWNCEKEVVGYLVLSVSESTPKYLSSSVIVNQVSVLRFVATFSTIANGYPGFTKVILKKLDPKSKPITLPWTG